jgi:hypothetical protein
LQRNGVNLNQGAESILSFLIALLNIIESCSPHRSDEQHPPSPVKADEPRPGIQAKMKE